MITALDIQNAFGGGPYELLVSDNLPSTNPPLTSVQQALLERSWKQGISLVNCKVWPSSADFWAAFTDSEKLAILASEIAGIILLREELRLWTGEVWSDDARVQSGLGGLVAVGILTNDRKAAILAK
jgi:hypothetical protein